MTTYAIANIQSLCFGDEIVRYLEQIDATLVPWEGYFVVHGATPKILEGNWSGDLIIIGFPDREHAMGWYESAAYQEILPLRRDNSTGPLIVIDAVEAGHRATDILPG